MKFSRTLLGKVLDSGLMTAFTSPVLQIREGSQPETPDSIATGSVLCQISMPTTGYFSASSGGVMSLAGSWSGLAQANGTAGWFRIKSGSDDNSASTTSVRIDGTIGANGDITLSEVVIAVNDDIDITDFSVSIDQIGFGLSSSGEFA